MSKFNRLQSTTALFLTLGLLGGTVTPIVTSMVAPAPVFAQTTAFSDVSASFWASEFIRELAQRDIIAGFPDGTFRPNAPVTRAQFAAMIRKAFSQEAVRNPINFVDVRSNYWAASAIQEAYTTGFLAGYPGNVFNPEQNIPREQVLVSLANGLDLTADSATEGVLSYYSDVASISGYARAPIAAATEDRLVVNYPTVRNLRPTQTATRAEVAAFIYQALVSQGTAQSITSQYIVSPTPVAQDFRIPSGTTLPVRYEQERILVTQNETVPLTLTVAANITTADGRVLIPVNSQVVGELRPASNGTQFVAQELVLANGQRISLDANSEVITETETVRKGTNVSSLIRNAAIGTAAAAAISAVTGDDAIATEELLLGAGAGAIVTLIRQFLGRNSVDLLVVEPDTDLDLTLEEDLVISAR
jgi:hypothetical protein